MTKTVFDTSPAVSSSQVRAIGGQVTPGEALAHYLERVQAAWAPQSRAAGRAERALDSGRGSLLELDPNRLEGAAVQASEALGRLAQAERYRVRGRLDVPAEAVDRTGQAIRDIVSGTQSLRRASMLLANPEVDVDPEARQSTLSALGKGAAHYRMAEWLLRTMPRPDEQAAPGNDNARADAAG